MNKEYNNSPVLNYYALILSIALKEIILSHISYTTSLLALKDQVDDIRPKEQKGEKFNFYYDAICPHLDNAQIDWIKEKIREQEQHTSQLLSARLYWYKNILHESNTKYIDFDREVISKQEPEVNPAHKEYQESLSHLRSVMNTIVDNQPQIKHVFNVPRENSFGSCRQQSIGAGDVNENFTGPHISKGPSLNSSQTQNNWNSKQNKVNLLQVIVPLHIYMFLILGGFVRRLS